MILFIDAQLKWEAEQSTTSPRSLCMQTNKNCLSACKTACSGPFFFFAEQLPPIIAVSE
jgi:hypothetical protein